MKILFVFGGIPHYAVPLLTKMVNRGVEITVLLPEMKSSVIGEGVKLSEDNNVYKIIRAKEKRSLWSGKSCFPELKSVIVSENPDRLYIGWPYYIDLFFRRDILHIMEKLDVRLVLREIPFQIPPFLKQYSYFKEHPVYDENMNLLSSGLMFYIKVTVLMFIRRSIYKRVAVMLSYASCAYDILPSYGIPKDKIFVTYNATDAEALWGMFDKIKETPLLLPSGKQRIIHIGRLVKWKRVDLLIQSFSKLIHDFPDIELLIVGDGPEKNNLIAMVKGYGIENHVIFVGALYDPFTLGKYMYESSIYVLAGMGGLSLNDAMAYSLPVVCSVCDGTEKDLIEDGYNGFFFEEGNADSLYEKLVLLLSSRELRDRMGRNARETIENKINLNVVCDRFVDGFNNAMKK